MTSGANPIPGRLPAAGAAGFRWARSSSANLTQFRQTIPGSASRPRNDETWIDFPPNPLISLNTPKNSAPIHQHPFTPGDNPRIALAGTVMRKNGWHWPRKAGIRWDAPGICERSPETVAFNRFRSDRKVLQGKPGCARSDGTGGEFGAGRARSDGT